MRCSDIINHLIAELPKRCDDFTDSIDLVSLTVDSGVAMATTSSAHGLAAGQQVMVTGSQVPIAGTIERVGTIATLTTTSDHDITENAGYSVQIEGSTGHDGTWTLLAAPNRRTLSFEVTGTEPASDSGNLINGSSIFNSYNGIHTVADVSETTFTYALAKDLLPASGGQIKGNPRISGATAFESLLASYTKQPFGDAWLFVVLGDGIAHKDRNTDTDSTANISVASNFNQRLSQSISLYVFMPTSSTLTGRAARDRCEELLGPICGSLLTARLPTLMSSDNNPLMFLNHGFEAYNSAFYVHQYSFEATIQLTNSDVYVDDQSVAFRDIDLTMAVSHGTSDLYSTITLDGVTYKILLTEDGTPMTTEDGRNLRIEDVFT